MMLAELSPLIDHTTWESVQTIMRERAAKSPFGGRSSVDVVQRHAVLLIDLAFSGISATRSLPIVVVGVPREATAMRTAVSQT
jgi:hypothetical protein